MTENTLAVETDETQGRDKRTLVIAGGVVGALVLGGAGYLLMSGGSDDTVSALPRKKAPRSATAVTKPAVKSNASVSKLPPATSVKIGRDPFAALYIAPKDAPAAPATTGQTPTTPTNGTATGEPYAITLTKVTSDPGGAKLFTFKIGTDSKTVLPAQRFGKYGELVVLTYTKNAKGAVTGAVLQVGDDNPVTAVIGAKLNVQ